MFFITEIENRKKIISKKTYKNNQLSRSFIIKQRDFQKLVFMQVHCKRPPHYQYFLFYFILLIFFYLLLNDFNLFIKSNT
jgi:hypothetical protein